MAKKNDGAGLFRRVTEKLFTSKAAPKRTDTRAKQVRERMYGGDTKRMAAAYGVSPRTVQRWVDGSRKNPPKAVAERLEAEATVVQTTSKGRERKARQIEAEPDSGIRLRVSRAGTFAIKGSDAVRQRDVDLYLSGEEAARFVRATTPDEANEAVGAALARYFNGGAFGGFQPGDFTFDPGDVSL